MLCPPPVLPLLPTASAGIKARVPRLQPVLLTVMQEEVLAQTAGFLKSPF